MVEFIAEQPHALEMAIPFYEDNLLDKTIPGRGVEKPVEFYQKQVQQLLLKLGAGMIRFVGGRYPGKPERYGYQILFSMNGIPGRIDCAALPLRNETAHKKDRALAQALFLVRSWLEAEVYSYVYRPGSVPLIAYLIGEDGKTVTEKLLETRGLPSLLASGG